MTYREQIAALLSAVEVVRDDAFRWFGEAVPVSVSDAQQPQAALIDALAEHLYQNFYTVGAPLRFPRSNSPSSFSTSNLQLRQQLERANACEGHAQRDWRVAAINGEQLLLARHALTVRMPASACRPLDGRGFAPGDRVAIDAPSARPWRSPGYYIVIGDSVNRHDDSDPVLRVYWNVRGQGRARLMQTLTNGLNALQLAFWFKVATGAESARCDQAVLYLHRRDLSAAEAVLYDAYRAISGDLRRAVPTLTLRLAPGIGAAEDPGNGESFGSDRCALLAQTIAGPDANLSEGIDAIATHFSRHGVDLDRPYQAADAASLAEFAFEAPRLAVSGQRLPGHAAGLRDRALDCARSIGDELKRSAVWHAGRCSWFGHQLSAGCCGGMHDAVAVAPLGADLYSGVGGVAWFLAELASSCNDSGLAASAIAAFRQADHLMASQRPDPGLYTGHLGTTLAMLHSADLLGEVTLESAARRWLMRSLEFADTPSGFDLVSGLAGRALGLALCGGLTGDDSCIAGAQRNADALIATAQRGSNGLCWADDDQPALLGYAHGTAGAAHALLEVFAVTGESAYRDAAEQAIAYEQSLFNPCAADWPDRRCRGMQVDLPASSRPQFSATWCHGAPGIALTRLRAFELLGDADYRIQADVALRAVENGLAASLESGIDDFSLCHGAAGSMAVLIEGRHTGATLDTAARRGIDELLPGQQWPSGLINGTSPSLMLGLAGIGHTYLCLADARTTTALNLGVHRAHNPSAPSDSTLATAPDRAGFFR